MGFSKEVYLKTNGFSKMRFGEDIDLSLRIIENGFITKLIKDAYVYHKRRNTIKQFFKQVYNSGIARINLYKKHPGSLKLVHTFPALFTIGVLLCLLSFLFFGVIFLFPIVFYALLVFFHSMISHRSLSIGLYSVAASYIQLIGYGLGFLYSFWERIVLHNDEFSAFNKNFYK